MRRSSLSALALLAGSAALLLGCAPASSASSTPSSTPVTSPSASAEPEVDPQLVITLDGVSFTDDEGTTTAAYDDSAALLALLEDATGVLPAPEAVEGMEGYDVDMQSYDWDGLRILADSAGEGPASIAVTAAEVDGIAVTTEEGVGVGSTREELLDAGGWALVDDEDPATAANLGLGGREVPDTESLTHPGSVGTLYLLFLLDGDTVTQINAPANDFSDL
jgi:hypothetical protein